MMKKTLTMIMVVAFIVALIGGAAYAWKGAGYSGYGCPAYTSVDPQKAQNFYNDTLPLRQKQLQLRGELMQLYAQPNPDWNAISQKKQEMAKVMTEFQKKAQEYGIGYGPGFGRMHGFGNCGKCW
ncbi:Spy/CpxP family protein refolding chaperone [Thermodesulfovibrio yellowstonii]|jgi:zinc resistance-associated protein|uniref:Zinc resistance-associated protein n=1 Tax=Thermodesulfovibrio yellowstonii (strain ATCC 51303 / DSM 11347 / YP87) TaxID=289376 RepID=B5YGF8_THEYD|nr:periplasmic heavy metal sensor [Thermodesulfovibrio yellowstonii]ACI20962.1 conserved hypothetical protein [Thermodesulfovibrio yellowstonii DSM 11347]